MSAIFTIPAGMPFAKTLAGEILERYGDAPETLADILILLPTRRACRTVREAFLQQSAGRPLILPRLQAIGDVDEEELALNLAGEDILENLINLPPGISLLKRQLLLARLIHSTEAFTQKFDHALVLARALGQFMDQIYTENLELSALKDLVPEEFAEHWQITLNFLEILSENWPKILEEGSVIDLADRRNRLILALAEHWQSAPPKIPIIAAGTTGSIPAVARLLSIIAELPQGQVVLPGLDQEIDQESWDALEETHPQFGFKQLLTHMNIDRARVQPWPNSPENPHSSARRHLAREVMRPAETTNVWTSLGTNKTAQKSFQTAFENLSLLNCTDDYEEAETIAVLMRETLETPEATAALITPDRHLARRVAMACKRWGVTLDDSAGQALDQTRTGTFFSLVSATCLENLAPISLLSTLKHSLCACKTEDIQSLERQALHGPKPEPGFQGLQTRLAEPDDKPTALLQTLETALAPLLALQNGTHECRTFLKTHIQACETLSHNPEQLWHHEDGEALSSFLAELLDQARYMPPLTLHTYHQIITQLMQGVTVRPAYGTHPRLMILGQLEARLIDADLVIMSGLNEGVWPPDHAHDPWLSRPMRKEFGLPVYERSVGLAAHDFIQGFCSPRIVITRAQRSGTSPTIPARWLQRLNAVLEAAGLSTESLTKTPHKQWAQNIDQNQNFSPCTRPAPRPPIDVRPKELSATRIETWLKDPYAIYARYVLNLKPLDPLEQPIDAAQRGTILHDILEQFITAHPDTLPENAEQILHDLAREALDQHHDDPEIWSFWWPRFERITTWFTGHERARRSDSKPLKTEAQGAVTINNFTITARADRIDQGPQGTIIIDYKSSGTYSKKSLHNGDAPQLPLEALILNDGGFSGIHKGTIQSLEYWVLTGKPTAPGKITAETHDIEGLITRTREGLERIISAFNNPETPYYSLPRDAHIPRFNDYEHLARIKEWTTLEQNESSGKAA